MLKMYKQLRMNNALKKWQLPIIPVDLELLGSVHSLQGAKALNKEHKYLKQLMISKDDKPARALCWTLSQTGGILLDQSDQSFAEHARTWKYK